MAWKVINICFGLVCSFSVFSQDKIEETRKNFGLDSRTSVFEISYNSERKVLKGKTNQINAKKELIAQFPGVIDSVQVLPQIFIDKHTHALVNVSVANLRVTPDESAELSSQMLMGTPLLLLEKHRGWYRVQCPDNYIGWVDGATIKTFTIDQIKSYQASNSYIYLPHSGFAYSDTSKMQIPVRDLTFACVFSAKPKGNYLQVTFPDYKIGYIKKSEAEKLEKWSQGKRKPNVNIVDSGYEFLGIPYLWGGTSPKGVDCSGFTRMAYLKNGIYLPRDASQQVLLGQEISIENNFKNLKEGDLLFFGNIQTKKVTHVGLWIGNHRFIHSSGMVQISSVDPKDSDFDAYNTGRLIVVKRLNYEQLKSNPKYSFPFFEYFEANPE